MIDHTGVPVKFLGELRLINLAAESHQPTMHWDFEDQLTHVNRGALGSTYYYIYDADGQRLRKVTESQAGQREKERIYLGGFEIYREYSGGTSITLESELFFH